MNRLLELLSKAQSGGPVVLWDGAVGTQLLQRGLVGQVPELWNLEQPEVLTGIHAEYLRAGSQVIQTNTFGATRIKLGLGGISDKIGEINRRGVEAGRKAVELVGHGLVAGDLGPTGQMMKPSGPLTPEEAEQVYAEQVKILSEAGADLISIETMFDLEEARAAVKGALSACKLPVVAEMTFRKTKRGFYTIMGVSPEDAARGLAAAGAVMVGANCSLAMPDMVELIRQMRKATSLPLIAQANAGDPQVVNGETVYNETAESFAAYAHALRDAGANAIGACCGSTPGFIAELRKTIIQA